MLQVPGHCLLTGDVLPGSKITKMAHIENSFKCDMTVGPLFIAAVCDGDVESSL